MITPGIFPPDAGGPATFSPLLGRALVDRGHDVKVVTNGTAPEGFDDAFPFEVVRVARSDNGAIRSVDQVVTLLRQVLAFDPDVVLTNAFDPQAVGVSRMTRTPVVTKIVGDYAWERARWQGRTTDSIDAFQELRQPLRVELYKLARTIPTRMADHVTVPSKYLRGIVQSWGVPLERISVIANACTVDVPDPPDIEDRPPHVSTVGRLVEWKGIHGIIDAFAMIADDHPRAELHIVGEGPRREELEARARATGYGSRIVFHGRRPHRCVLDLLANSRVFALNSTFEGLPHVVLEAMACGTPVVASDAGGTPEAVVDGQSGVLVEQGDTAAFGRQLSRLLHDPELCRTLQGAGFERVGDFGVNEMVDGYEQLFRAIGTHASGIQNTTPDGP